LTRAGLDKRKLAASRLWATTQMPYLAAALFAAPIRAEPGCGTVAADRSWEIQADPDVVDQLSVEELGRLLLHLLGHLIRDHAQRADVVGLSGTDGPERWNRAADAEINDDLVAMGLVPRVAPDLPGDFAQAIGGLAESYLQAAPAGRPWDCGSGCDGRPRPWDAAGQPLGEDGHGLTGQQAALLRSSVAAAIHQASAQQPGSIPGGWLRWAETVLPSRVDWRRVLAAEIRQGVASVAGAVDYTYRRPSRRAQAAPRVVLPSLHRPVPEVAIVCDTSGSMHDQLLARALAEVEGILSRAGVRQAQVRVLAVDTNVQAVRRVTRASQVQLAGGGGTDMAAGIAAAVALRPRPSVVIVLTDGYTPWPSRPPPATRVVAGILTQNQVGMRVEPPPAWVRAVLID